MKQTSLENPNYGNWVSKKLIYVPGMVGLIFLALSLMFSPLIILAVLFLLVSAYFVYARYLFSPSGGNVQEKVRDLVLLNLDWDGAGQVLDIGCGSGALAMAIAKKYGEARVIGIDYWGKQWEYSKNLCERNAEIEGVAGRVSFQKGSAAALPFDDESMDAAVSNLVFHEVGGVKDKRVLIQEALRVVRKGGVFVFQDLFLWKRIYGDSDELIEALRSRGVSEVELMDTSHSDFIPKILKLPFMVGTIGIIVGEK
jgi:SAM-dependent methyltransferase